MKLRAPLIATAVAIASSVLLNPAPADAQVVRVGRPRASVVVRPRATVFVGGYYYPRLYRASLYYGSYGRYYGPSTVLRAGGYYGASYYQYPPYYGGGFYDLSGAARLQVTPRQTEVFIDGYYAGTVDDFDGFLQRLRLEAGEHEIELYLSGYRPFRQRIYLQPGRTFNLRHVMQPLGPGDAPPVRPVGAPLPAPGQADPRDPGVGPRPPYPPQGGPGPERQGPGTQAPAAGFGQLALRVQPGDAEILIDGEKWEGGATDERLVVQLGAGMHRLEIRKEGYRNYFTDITVRGGATTTLNVAMTRQ